MICLFCIYNKHEKRLKEEFNIKEEKLEYIGDPSNNEILLDGCKIQINSLQISNTGYNSVFGKKLLFKGEHHYKFRMLHMTGGSSNWNHVIGFSLENNCKEK